MWWFIGLLVIFVLIAIAGIDLLVRKGIKTTGALLLFTGIVGVIGQLLHQFVFVPK